MPPEAFQTVENVNKKEALQIDIDERIATQEDADTSAQFMEPPPKANTPAQELTNPIELDRMGQTMPLPRKKDGLQNSKLKKK